MNKACSKPTMTQASNSDLVGVLFFTDPPETQIPSQDSTTWRSCFHWGVPSRACCHVSFYDLRVTLSHTVDITIQKCWKEAEVNFPLYTEPNGITYRCMIFCIHWCTLTKTDCRIGKSTNQTYHSFSLHVIKTYRNCNLRYNDSIWK